MRSLLKSLFKIFLRRKTPKRFDSDQFWELVPFDFSINWMENLDSAQPRERTSLSRLNRKRFTARPDGVRITPY